MVDNCALCHIICLYLHDGERGLNFDPDKSFMAISL